MTTGRRDRLGLASTGPRHVSSPSSSPQVVERPVDQPATLLARDEERAVAARRRTVRVVRQLDRVLPAGLDLGPHPVGGRRGAPPVSWRAPDLPPRRTQAESAGESVPGLEVEAAAVSGSAASGLDPAEVVHRPRPPHRTRRGRPRRTSRPAAWRVVGRVVAAASGGAGEQAEGAGVAERASWLLRGGVGLRIRSSGAPAAWRGRPAPSCGSRTPPSSTTSPSSSSSVVEDPAAVVVAAGLHTAARSRPPWRRGRSPPGAASTLVDACGRRQQVARRRQPDHHRPVGRHLVEPSERPSDGWPRSERAARGCRGPAPAVRQRTSTTRSRSASVTVAPHG